MTTWGVYGVTVELGGYTGVIVRLPYFSFIFTYVHYDFLMVLLSSFLKYFLFFFFLLSFALSVMLHGLKDDFVYREEILRTFESVVS